MWVAGDLKDRLGIRHRKESKNKPVADLETAPMFREPHARSASELATQQVYEPTTPRSPEGSDTSGKDDVIITTGSSKLVASQLLNPHETGVTAVSPSPSYYSVSDIPPPSPMPPSLYRYPSGEITSQVPSLTSHSLSPEPPVPRLEYSRSASSPSTVAESYELQVRQPSSPSHDWTQSHSPLQNPSPPTAPEAHFSPGLLHGHNAGEGRYRPGVSDIKEYEPDSSVQWDSPHAL